MKTLRTGLIYCIILVFVVTPVMNGCASTSGSQRAEAQVVEAPLAERLAGANADVLSAQNAWNAKLVTLTEKYNEWNQAKSDLGQLAEDATAENRRLKETAERVAYQNLEKAGQIAFPEEWKNLQVLKARVVALQPVAEPAEEAEPLVTGKHHTVMGICHLAKFESLPTTFWLADAELEQVKASLNKNGRSGETCDKNDDGVYVVPDRYELSINNYRAHPRRRNWQPIGQEFPAPVAEQVQNSNVKLVVDDQRTDRQSREVRTEEVEARPVDRTQTGPRRSLLQSGQKAQLEAQWTQNNSDGTADVVRLRGEMPLPETKIIVVKDDDELEPWEVGLIVVGTILLAGGVAAGITYGAGGFDTGPH